MEYKDFKNKINNEYKRVQIARLAGIGFDVYSHDTEHPRKDLIGYCIPTSEDSFEFFIQSDIKTGLEKLTDSILLSGGYNSMNINKLKVIGGTSLKDLNYAFEMCDIRTLDLSLLDTSNITHMNNTFCSLNNKQLILPEVLRLKNLIVIDGVFIDIDTESTIIIKDIDLPELKSADKAFSEARIATLYIENVIIEQITDISKLFDYAVIGALLIKNVKMPRLRYMNSTFKHIYTHKAIINIDTSNVKSFTKVFNESHFDYLDISSWSDGDNAIIADTFTCCEIEEKIIMDSKAHPRLFEAFNNRK